MKKVIAMLSVFVMCFSFAGCKSKDEDKKSSSVTKENMYDGLSEKDKKILDEIINHHQRVIDGYKKAHGGR